MRYRRSLIHLFVTTYVATHCFGYVEFEARYLMIDDSANVEIFTKFQCSDSEIVPGSNSYYEIESRILALSAESGVEMIVTQSDKLSANDVRKVESRLLDVLDRERDDNCLPDNQTGERYYWNLRVYTGQRVLVVTRRTPIDPLFLKVNNVVRDFVNQAIKGRNSEKKMVDGDFVRPQCVHVHELLRAPEMFDGKRVALVGRKRRGSLVIFSLDSSSFDDREGVLLDRLSPFSGESLEAIIQLEGKLTVIGVFRHLPSGPLDLIPRRIERVTEVLKE